MFRFTKMHALGNDFVVIDGVDADVSFHPSQAKAIADRHTGIGCDQILLVNRQNNDTNLFGFRIYNADGSESDQCGNGARCIARLVHDRGYARGPEFVLRTRADDLHCAINGADIVVALGVPRFKPAEIPFIADSEQETYQLEIDRETVEISALAIGNPHAVVLVRDVARAPVHKSGPAIESHARFPNRTNVGYLEVVSTNQVRLRVYERGVGETLACGSGASAAVIAGIRRGLLDAAVEVSMTAGTLSVEWRGDGSQVFLSGPAAYVYEGRWFTD